MGRRHKNKRELKALIRQMINAYDMGDMVRREYMSLEIDYWYNSILNCDLGSLPPSKGCKDCSKPPHPEEVKSHIRRRLHGGVETQ